MLFQARRGIGLAHRIEHPFNVSKLLHSFFLSDQLLAPLDPGMPGYEQHGIGDANT
jgi:hypothetical protein